MTDIFISYSRQDQAWVAKLAKAFEGLGYDVWWDTQLLAGEDFAHIIPVELEKARCVVVVWSKMSVTRKWVRSEATRADNRGVLVPVRCEAADIPMPLDLLHTEDMRGWNGKPEHPAFQKLLRAVSRYCPLPNGESPPPPPPPPRKFLWLPALLISAVVLGVGGYWQVVGKSSVGASPAGDSFVQQTSPVKKESLAGQALTTARDPIAAFDVLAEEQAKPEPSPPVAQPAVTAIKPDMQPIPAGKFMMGCVDGRDDVEGGCEDDEKPAHEVSINAFEMGKYEVTFEQWDACEEAKACPHADDSGWGRGNRPVINVSWEDITQKYIPWLNQQTGKHYRLPTEAEWEYAVRGSSDKAYPWGMVINCSNADFWFGDSSCDGAGTSPIGSYTANDYGLYDMVGNVWEWCQDRYGGDYYKSSPASNPQGSSIGASRVSRGGSWIDDAPLVRSADRDHLSSGGRRSTLGFRLAHS